MTKLLSLLVALAVAPHVHAADELIGYVLLKEEFKATGQSDAEYAARIAQLDLLSSQTLAQINSKSDFKNEADAKSILSTIDSVLAKNGYQIQIPVDSLWDALSRTTKENIGRVNTPAMHRRERDVDKYKANYVYDCDTGSMIYLHILEQAKAPVCIVETKGHNFVRWRLSDSSYVNWDVNSGAAYSDDEFRKGGVGFSRGFTMKEEVAAGYLTDMSRQQLLSYHQLLVARMYRNRKLFDQAIEAYKKAIIDTPDRPVPHNNLAWMIAVEPTLQRPELLDLSLAEATTAVKLNPYDGDYIDTLAATCAARRDFANALIWEQSQYGNKDRSRIAVYQEMKKTPAELGWK